MAYDPNGYSPGQFMTTNDPHVHIIQCPFCLYYYVNTVKHKCLNQPKRKRIYIAGPMRGIPEFNFPAFDKARDCFNSWGWEAVSPADIDRANGIDVTGKAGNDEDFPMEVVKEILKRDLEAVATCSAIALLPGWQKSRGANLELAYARLIKLEVYDATTGQQFDPDSQPLPNKDTEGVKYDDGKPRYDLLAPEALDGLVAVLTFGARKYTDRNWEKGINYCRVFAAAMRHLWAWMAGRDRDPESGLSHLDHAACCIHFLSTFEKRGLTKFDDRVKL